MASLKQKKKKTRKTIQECSGIPFKLSISEHTCTPNIAELSLLHVPGHYILYLLKWVYSFAAPSPKYDLRLSTEKTACAVHKNCSGAQTLSYGLQHGRTTRETEQEARTQ